MTMTVSQEAVEMIGNRFDLVLVASRRARELSHGYRSHISDKNSPVVLALKEIEQGHVGIDYLLKPTDVDNNRKMKNKDRDYR
jgi:DNA-directed RNA polymerase subunit omega